eukprot:TRINITY_DN1587_c0_g1_i1.p1 TRINITY_DN1587_c0_g1~~TRINITY_DN1587_c0_g1_i1.p1  ORF type:complete len:174 (+),score=57.13 TRINITY_DN1587_c0_g1_i1:88-609(+)
MRWVRPNHEHSRSDGDLLQTMIREAGEEMKTDVVLRKKPAAASPLSDKPSPINDDHAYNDIVQSTEDAAREAEQAQKKKFAEEQRKQEAQRRDEENARKRQEMLDARKLKATEARKKREAEERERIEALKTSDPEAAAAIEKRSQIRYRRQSIAKLAAGGNLKSIKDRWNVQG